MTSSEPVLSVTYDSFPILRHLLAIKSATDCFYGEFLRRMERWIE